MPLRPRRLGSTAPSSRSISTPLPNSPARSSLPRRTAHRLFRPMSTATAERGPLHHPEFTMLEWYRAEESYETLMHDCAGILALAVRQSLRGPSSIREERAILRRAGAALVAEAFARFAGIDLLASIRDDGSTDRDSLAAAMREVGFACRRRRSLGHLFSRVLVERVEPNLGFGRATILDEYPVAEAALARPAAGDPRVAERFRALCLRRRTRKCLRRIDRCREQRRRFELEWRKRRGSTARPTRSTRISSRRSPACPEASGIALGFDRPGHAGNGASRIDQVLWAPVAEARP